MSKDLILKLLKVKQEFDDFLRGHLNLLTISERIECFVFSDQKTLLVKLYRDLFKKSITIKEAFDQVTNAWDQNPQKDRLRHIQNLFKDLI